MPWRKGGPPPETRLSWPTPSVAAADGLSALAECGSMWRIETVFPYQSKVIS